MNFEDQPSNRILRLKDVIIQTGLSRSSIYLKVADGSFPTPIKLGLRSVGWVESEISIWVDQQIEQTRNTALECK